MVQFETRENINKPDVAFAADHSCTLGQPLGHFFQARMTFVVSIERPKFVPMSGSIRGNVQGV